MAWCQSIRSAAHAIGVFIPNGIHDMRTKRTNGSAAKVGTMNASGDAALWIAAARAQTELIDTLARLLLASVEQEQSRAGETADPPIRPAGPPPEAT